MPSPTCFSFASTKGGKGELRTLQEYVDGMKEGQEYIYYMPATVL